MAITDYTLGGWMVQVHAALPSLALGYIRIGTLRKRSERITACYDVRANVTFPATSGRDDGGSR
jgi:hypothetical protein